MNAVMCRMSVWVSIRFLCANVLGFFPGEDYGRHNRRHPARGACMWGTDGLVTKSGSRVGCVEEEVGINVDKKKKQTQNIFVFAFGNGSLVRTGCCEAVLWAGLWKDSSGEICSWTEAVMWNTGLETLLV